MSTVKVKRRHTTGGTPSTVDGELSVNSFDKKIFIGNGTTAVELANQLGYSTISTVGTITSGTWNGSAIGTAYGGTGLTSFTSGGLLYASSTSALTTGSVFSVTVGGGSNLNRKINISTTIGSSIGYSASESTYGSSIFLGLESDFSGGISTYSNPIFQLSGATTNTYMQVEPSGLSQIAFTATTYYPSYDGGVTLTWLQTENNMSYAKLILGYDYGGNTKITITDNAFSGCSMVIEAPTLQINTTTPAAGKVLTCTDSNGTVSWQDDTGATLALYNSGVI